MKPATPKTELPHPPSVAATAEDGSIQLRKEVFGGSLYVKPTESKVSIGQANSKRIFLISSPVLTILTTMLLVLSSCSSKPKLVGKWQEIDGSETMQFFKDGTVSLSDKQEKYVGTFTLLDADHLKLELGGIAALAGPMVFTFSLNRDVLKMKDSEGKVSSYRRAGASMPPPVSEKQRRITNASRRLESGINSRESDRSWHTVSSSADGVKLVATVYGGQIYTSSDSGMTWIAHEGVRPWNGVASSADGTKLIASVYGGQLYISRDSGFTWIPQEESRNWASVASSSDGTKLIAVDNGAGVEGKIYTSTNSGSNWVPHDISEKWWAVACSTSGDTLVVVTRPGPIYMSVDGGANWNKTDMRGEWTSVACSSDGIKLIATLWGGQIYTSTNGGLNWTAREMSRNWHGVSCSGDGSKLVAIVYGGQIWTSSDFGVVLEPQEINRNWSSIVSSVDGTRWVALENGGKIYIRNSKR